MAQLKSGLLTEAEEIEAHERRHYALRWLERYAPEKFVFKLQDEVPEGLRNLSAIQTEALKTLADYLESEPTMPGGEALHQKLHEIKEALNIAPGELFSAIYLSFLGKAYGPKAGWFLSVLDREFVLARLRAVAG
jgi:lysyl-tRNA synthetase class 1